MCSTVCNASTCDRGNPCSSSSLSDELNYQLTQGSEIIDDENEHNQIINYSIHPSSYFLLHEDNSSNQISHDNFPFHTYSIFLSYECFNLSNLVVEVEKSDRDSDRDGFHLVNSDLIKISERSYPHSVHDLVQSLGCDFTILDTFGTC